MLFFHIIINKKSEMLGRFTLFSFLCIIIPMTYYKLTLLVTYRITNNILY